MRSPHPTPFVKRLRLPPVWTLAIALVAACAVVAWQMANGSAARMPGTAWHLMFWPGAVVFVAVYLFAWLGWALDID